MSELDNAVRMRIEFDIAAQKCLTQVILTNDRIEELLKSGIQKSF